MKVTIEIDCNHFGGVVTDRDKKKVEEYTRRAFMTCPKCEITVTVDKSVCRKCGGRGGDWALNRSYIKCTECKGTGKPKQEE